MRRATADVLAALAFISLALGLCGCSGYWRHRANDLADCARLNAGIGFGASIDASAGRYLRLSAGSYENTAKAGFVGRQGGIWIEERHGLAFIAGYTETSREPVLGNAYLAGPPPDSDLQPAWADRERGPSEVVVSLHLLVAGVEAGIDPGQMLDFLLGFAGIDLYLDDRPPTALPPAPPAAVQEIPQAD